MRKIKLGKNERMTFSKIPEAIELPNLIEVQKDSYEWFIREGLTVIDSFLDYDNLVMSMIRDYYQNNNYTYSATIGVIYFVCILALVGLVSLVMRKLVVYMYQ